MGENDLTKQGNFGDLRRFQNFAKISYLLVKFDKRHDGDVGGPVRSTLFELCQNFVQKWNP